MTKPFRIEIPGLGIAVSALVNKPDLPEYSMVLSHGAGAPMTHPFMEQLAFELWKRDILTIRFNFPYIEMGRKSPGSPEQAQNAVEAVSRFAQDEISQLPLFLGGKSYGGRMSSHLMAEGKDLSVKGLIFYGFPLHAPGRAGTERANHLQRVEVPMLFLQGTRDHLAKRDLVEHLVDSLDLSSVRWYEEADHSFKTPKNKGMDQNEIIADLAQQTREFMDQTMG